MAKTFKIWLDGQTLVLTELIHCFLINLLIKHFACPCVMKIYCIPNYISINETCRLSTSKYFQLCKLIHPKASTKLHSCSL